MNVEYHKNGNGVLYVHSLQLLLFLILFVYLTALGPS